MVTEHRLNPFFRIDYLVWIPEGRAHWFLYVRAPYSVYCTKGVLSWISGHQEWKRSTILVLPAILVNGGPKGRLGTLTKSFVIFTDNISFRYVQVPVCLSLIGAQLSPLRGRGKLLDLGTQQQTLVAWISVQLRRDRLYTIFLHRESPG